MDMRRRETGDKETAMVREASARPVRQALRDQDLLWDQFLAMGLSVVHSLSKSVTVVCEGRLDVVPEVKSLEREFDRADVRIEQECLRALALFEPVASDLRRLATILKVSRDWERIGDHSARIARRARKLAKNKDAGALPVPEPLKALACEVLAQVCASYEALAGHDADRAREVIREERSIDRRYRSLRHDLKESLRQRPNQFNSWLQLMSTARNLERIADHATDIAESIVYLQEGVIIRHQDQAHAARD